MDAASTIFTAELVLLTPVCLNTCFQPIGVKVQKVIKCKVASLTNVKRELLTQEYENLQRFLHGDNSVRLYSAYKQQAERFYKRVKDKEYPLVNP